jgi:hypothetical protein
MIRLVYKELIISLGMRKEKLMDWISMMNSFRLGILSLLMDCFNGKIRRLRNISRKERS